MLRARFKPRARAGFRATDTIRSKPAFFADMHPVVTPSGRAVLAWSAQFASEGGDRGPVYFQAATRAGRRAPLRAARGCSSRSRRAPTAGSAARSTPSSTPPARWRSPGAAPARRARRRAAAAPAQDLSAPGTTAVLSDLAAGPGGRLVAVWDGGVEDPQSVVRAAIADGAGAAVRPARGRLRRRPGGRASATPRSSATARSSCSSSRAAGGGRLGRAGLREVDRVGGGGRQERDRDPDRHGGGRLVQVPGAPDQEAEHHQGDERRRRGLVHGGRVWSTI